MKDEAEAQVEEVEDLMDRFDEEEDIEVRDCGTYIPQTEEQIEAMYKDYVFLKAVIQIFIAFLIGMGLANLVDDIMRRFF